jgi:hypothetical protein
MCIHITKDDPWTQTISAGSTDDQIDAAYTQRCVQGLRVMAGGSLLLNATDITIHNANMRHVMPPHSHQKRNLRLSYLAPTILMSDTQSGPEIILSRALQIADFLFEAFDDRDHRAPPPKSVTIFRPLRGPEPGVSQDLEELKGTVSEIMQHMFREMEVADRKKSLRQVDSVEWVLESQMPKGESGICDVCNGE